jgi:formylglycine-generating enzyme required for sulfatase activity
MSSRATGSSRTESTDAPGAGARAGSKLTESSPTASPNPLDGGQRAALVIATGRYEDPALTPLQGAGRDAADLAEVLGDAGLGAFDVTVLADRTAQEIRLGVDEFLDGRAHADLALVYLSCHGVLDARNRLYFAARDTRKDRLAATGIEAEWLLDLLEHCQARRQVVIIDSCFSGAFIPGAKGPDDLHLPARFLGSGRGRTVITASRRTELSFETSADGAPVRSVFTSTLVRGLRSGEADRDRDGVVSVDEAYEYTFDAMMAAGASQTPQRSLAGGEGKIILTRSPATATASETSPSRQVHYRDLRFGRSGSMEVAAVPAGKAAVVVGVPAGFDELAASPRRTPEVGSFMISRYPVTRKQYQHFVDDDGYGDDRWWDSGWSFGGEGRHWGKARPFGPLSDLPALVTRYEAIAYCRWVSKTARIRVHVPSRAQWIRAARGDARTLYPWGDDFDCGRCNSYRSSPYDQATVDSFPLGASRFGVEDLSGNCPEWVVLERGAPDGFENSASFHPLGTWPESMEAFDYSIDFVGEWSAPDPSVRAAFRVAYP